MDINNLKTILDVGETIAVEFKLCSGGISDDTYKTVCSFLNRFGGDLFLGVDDNGTVVGIPPNAISGVIKNFISMVGNVDIISPTVYLSPDIISYQGKEIIHIHISASPEVHTYKKVIYDRVDDADVKVTSTSQISMLYIRKQKIYTERDVFKYVKDEDLRLDMFPTLVQMAINSHLGVHAWENMSVPQIIKSARLKTQDAESGILGYNRAAVMLLGRDEVIKDVCPTYRTDALLRKVNMSRYDDRLTVETNLIDSFNLLMGFATKHLPDKFYLENVTRISLRNAIAREMLVNTLIHREYSSRYIARFIIERERMYTENANIASFYGNITPENNTPNPKNPIIMNFFRNIGRADELGSGVTNLFNYGRKYSGKDPELIEGDVFKIVVPLDDDFSFDADTVIVRGDEQDTLQDNGKIEHSNSENDTLLNETQKKIVALMAEKPEITTTEIAELLGITRRQIEKYVSELKTLGIIKREGSNKNGCWVVKSNL